MDHKMWVGQAEQIRLCRPWRLATCPQDSEGGARSCRRAHRRDRRTGVWITQILLVYEVPTQCNGCAHQCGIAPGGGQLPEAGTQPGGWRGACIEVGQGFDLLGVCLPEPKV